MCIRDRNTAVDTAQWENTLTQASIQAPDAEFIVSAGDQVSVGNNEKQYAGYLEQDVYKRQEWSCLYQAQSTECLQREIKDS